MLEHIQQQDLMELRAAQSRGVGIDAVFEIALDVAAERLLPLGGGRHVDTGDLVPNLLDLLGQKPFAAADVEDVVTPANR